ncbi:hypothetical protein [Modicisalibacter ilicicola]|uniref:hypothetical protein n=1 Tax=Modicisalibacter ilicicola TaxID=480814 RepID=UPI001114F576|nr:hypothetical protein [Halomonas ilicicola]
MGIPALYLAIPLSALFLYIAYLHYKIHRISNTYKIRQAKSLEEYRLSKVLHQVEVKKIQKEWRDYLENEFARFSKIRNGGLKFQAQRY